MKNIILPIIFLSMVNYVNAQKTSYGFLLGINIYDVEVDGPLLAESGSGLNVGGFVDYKINESIGIKGNVIYSTVKEGKYDVLDGNQLIGTLFEEAKIKSLQLHTLLKYDVNKSYNKGFYLTAGIKMTNVLDAKLDGQKDKDFYKSTTFGALLGFGAYFNKFIAIELVPEMNLTNTLNSDVNKTKNYGFYANLIVNLDSLLEK